MCFKISKKQLWILIVIALVGALIGYSSTQTLYGIGPDPNEALRIPYTILGFIIGGALAYLIEIIYNKIKEK